MTDFERFEDALKNGKKIEFLYKAKVLTCVKPFKFEDTEITYEIHYDPKNCLTVCNYVPELIGNSDLSNKFKWQFFNPFYNSFHEYKLDTGYTMNILEVD